MESSNDTITDSYDSTIIACGQGRNDLVDDVPEKTLGSLASLALLANNMTGPAMMGLPYLFLRAGIIPVVSAVTVAWVATSLVATLLCETIASIPGNTNFTKNISFSSACKTIIGGRWYIIAEWLFLLSCIVQACAGLVETAHALDGFLAYFLLGRTFALQLLPTVAFIDWLPSECKGVSLDTDTSLHDAYEPSDCTPFYDDGPLVITLGFLIATAIFMPLGLAHLKETMIIQYISFFCLLLSISQFEWEFLSRGLTSSVPWIGNDFSSLVGVILFNYAVTLTIPSWLSEKTPTVHVGRAVWGATSLVSILYVSFGLLATLAFDGVTDEMLTILSSSKTHLYTRIYAALFGVIIIGGGVPVFCVVIKTALQANGNMSPRYALFWGSIFPYAASWMMYQGSLLMQVLNWTGLVVNGTAAFILPLVLTVCALRSRNRIQRRYNTQTQKHTLAETVPLVDFPVSVVLRTHYDSVCEPSSDISGPVLSPTNSIRTGPEMSIQNPSSSELLEEDSNIVKPLPAWLEPYRMPLVMCMIAFFAVAILVTIGVDILQQVLPAGEDSK